MAPESKEIPGPNEEQIYYYRRESRAVKAIVQAISPVHLQTFEHTQLEWTLFSSNLLKLIVSIVRPQITFALLG